MSLALPATVHPSSSQPAAWWRSSLTPLGASHLAFLALISAYLCLFYPPASAAVLAMLGTAIVAEVFLARWRRFLLGEFLLLLGAGCSYVWLVDRATDSFPGWVRMLLAYWLLIPSRPGLLRWVLSLALLELLILGKTAGPMSPAFLLVPTALASLAVDNWLRGVSAAGTTVRRSRIPRGLLRWSLVPCLAVSAAALLCGPALVSLANHAGLGPAGLNLDHERKSMGLDQIMRFGDHHWVDKDPRIAARLLWEDDAVPSQPAANIMYLRALTLPTLALASNQVSWIAEHSAQAHSYHGAPFNDHASWAWVLRHPGKGGMILHPDGGIGVELDNQLVDRDGNLFKPGLDDAIRIYRVNLDNPEVDAEPVKADDYRKLPEVLDSLPWSVIEDPRWKTLGAEDAAQAIGAMLQERCSYDLENLPKPRPGIAGALYTFLFGSQADRRGHCQYFASAATILLRRSGHAARCVAGFASNEWDSQGVTFRGYHAHAWIEVLTSKGRWQRYDPTPPSRIAMREPESSVAVEAKQDLGELKKQIAEEEAKAAAQARTWPFPATIAALCALAALLGLWLTRRPGIADPRQAALQRQVDSLFKLAARLGIPVGIHTTLSELAAKLRERTGVDLDGHLQDHLAARFGGGPLPRPWPVSELLAAAVVVGGSASGAVRVGEPGAARAPNNGPPSPSGEASRGLPPGKTD